MDETAESLVQFKQLVLAALNKGLQIHGGDGRVDGVYSVMVTTTTSQKIVVLAVGTDANHETALRYALTNALKRCDTTVPFERRKK